MTRDARRAAMCLVSAFVVITGCGGGGRAEPYSTGASTAPPATAALATPTSVIATPSTASIDRQAMLDDKRTSYGAPGALAVVRDGNTQWSGVSGTADQAGSALTDTSRFRIASITKSIVAALVLDAVGRGEISLDDTVSFPGVLRPDPPISVRMLLDHTSGVFNVGDEGDPIADIANLTDPALHSEATDLVNRYLAGEPAVLSDRLFVALAETHDRYFQPGTGYHYSNTNYQLAAMVLTKATGLPLAELLRTRIVDELQLHSTTLAPSDAGLPEMHGYDATGESLVDLTGDLMAFGNGGSGGVISTAGELLTIMQAIVSGRLLPSALVDQMKDATTQSSTSYGLGLATYYLSCGTFFGHAGAVDGTESIAIVSPDGTAGTVIAINLRDTTDPNLLALAESYLCGRT